MPEDNKENKNEKDKENKLSEKQKKIILQLSKEELEELKKLPPRKRLEKIKELEEKKRKELEELEKLLEESEFEIVDEEEKEKIIISKLKENDEKKEEIEELVEEIEIEKEEKKETFFIKYKTDFYEENKNNNLSYEGNPREMIDRINPQYNNPNYQNNSIYQTQQPQQQDLYKSIESIERNVVFNKALIMNYESSNLLKNMDTFEKKELSQLYSNIKSLETKIKDNNSNLKKEIIEKKEALSNIFKNLYK